MMANRVLRVVVVLALFFGLNASTASATEFLRPVVSELSDGIKFQMPTKVDAGTYFQVTLISKKKKINGICWWDWALAKGFDTPKQAKISKGIAKVKVLPIQPGAGTLSFFCGPNRGNPLIGGSAKIYIAP